MCSLGERAGGVEGGKGVGGVVLRGEDARGKAAVVLGRRRLGIGLAFWLSYIYAQLGDDEFLFDSADVWSLGVCASLRCSLACYSRAPY